jgi:hypothetical protein
MVVNAYGDCIPFPSVTRKDVFPHINVENTLLQIMANNLFTGDDLPLDSYDAGLRIIDRLTHDDSLWFLGDERNHNPLKQITIPGDQTSIFGIGEDIFRDSVKKIKCRPRMEELWKKMSPEPIKTRELTCKNEGLVVALVMLEEVSDDNLKSLKMHLKSYSHRQANEDPDKKDQWEALEVCLDEQKQSEAGYFWRPALFWDIRLEKELYNLKPRHP